MHRRGRTLACGTRSVRSSSRTLLAAAELVPGRSAAATTFGSGMSCRRRASRPGAPVRLRGAPRSLLSTSFTFESCDTVCRHEPTVAGCPHARPGATCRWSPSRWPRTTSLPTCSSRRSSRSRAIDYRRLEIVVIDNNTKDPDVWRPVEEYCRDRPRVRFVHVDPLDGFKSGALNLALRAHTHPDAEIIGIIDADYLVDPAWLARRRRLLRRPHRRLRPDAAGLPRVRRRRVPAGVLRRVQVLLRDEHAVAATSATRSSSRARWGSCAGPRSRRSAAGTSGASPRTPSSRCGCSSAATKACTSTQSYGHGIMPLTFSALKSQRFRWCFGGMQILRRHWRDLVALAPDGREPPHPGPARRLPHRQPPVDERPRLLRVLDGVGRERARARRPRAVRSAASVRRGRTPTGRADRERCRTSVVGAAGQDRHQPETLDPGLRQLALSCRAWSRGRASKACCAPRASSCAPRRRASATGSSPRSGRRAPRPSSPWRCGGRAVLIALRGQATVFVLVPVRVAGRGVRVGALHVVAQPAHRAVGAARAPPSYGATPGTLHDHHDGLDRGARRRRGRGRGARSSSGSGGPTPGTRRTPSASRRRRPRARHRRPMPVPRPRRHRASRRPRTTSPQSPSSTTPDTEPTEITEPPTTVPPTEHPRRRHPRPRRLAT